MSPARVVQAGLAGTAIAAILVGAPVLLFSVAAALLPDRWPQADVVVSALTRPDDGRVLLAVIVGVGILAWAQLSLSLLAELIAGVTRRPAGRVELPGLRASRVLAALLVAALLGPGSGAASAALPQPVALVALLPEDTPSSPVDATAAGYVVAQRDTLWRIAERVLGDPLRWREIFDLNAGRVQPDGGRLTEASLLHVGWRLVLPADAAPTAGSVTVQPGDTLSELAEAHLGDPDATTTLFERNRGLDQPDGRRLTDPDLIRPGWTLTLPGGSTPTTREGPPAPPPVPAVPQPAPPPAPLPSSPPTAPPEPLPRTPPAERPGADEDPRSAADGSGDDLAAEEAGTDAVLPVTLGASALLVGGIIAALTVRRRRQLRFRRPRHRIAVADTAAGRAEWTATTSPPPVDGTVLDAALRGLTVPDWTDSGPPVLDSVVLRADRAVLHLATDAALPLPFQPDDSGRSWVLPATAELPLAVDEAGGYCAPFPTLASIATDADDALLLVDLEALGVTHLAGPQERTVDLLRHIAAELANQRWAEDVEVLLVGFGTELVPLNPDRLRVLPDLAAGLAEIRARLRAAETTMRELEVASATEGRFRGVAPDAWLPVVLLAAGDDPPQAELLELGTRITQGPRRPVAVVTTGLGPIGIAITLSDDGTVHLPRCPEGDWSALHVSADTGAGLAAILAPTLQPDIPADPAVEPHPWARGMNEDGTLDTAHHDHGDEPDPEGAVAARPVPTPRPPEPPPGAEALGPVPATDPDAERRLAVVEHQDPDLDVDLRTWWGDNPPPVPCIGILGAPVVRAPGEPPSARPSWFVEILVYLALHPLGVTIQQALTDLWPEGRKITLATVRHAFYGARRWAGRGLDGDPDRPFVSDMLHDNTYRLAGHLLDWDLFRRLRKRAEARYAAGHPGAANDYQAALRLIRGPVLSALRPAGYAWLNNHDQRHDLQIPAFLIDAAHELVDIALARGDTALARSSADTARTVDRDVVFDRPLTDLMRVAHAEDRPTEMERYAEILLDARGFDVPEELPPETFAVLNALLPTGPRRTRP